jgi:hypothetical protein
MSQPWKKQWPRIGARRRSYVVGFYDHERRERTRTFTTATGVGGAGEWMNDYRAAERRGDDSLRRFLLDLDAREANVAEGRMLGEVIELYFSLDADPKLDGGLAEQTFRGYRTSANCHLLGRPVRNHKRQVVGRHAYAVWVSKQPASAFNEPHAPRELRERMRQAGQPQTKIKETWKVLSAILSWAAGSHDVPEVHTNGCLRANERTTNRRRSVRARGCGGAQRDKRKTGRVPSWALSPRAVEAIRYEMLHSSKCSELIAARNAVIVSTERRCDTPGLVWADVLQWRALLRAHGFPALDHDFVIPNLARQDYGVLDECTGAVHLSVNQCKKWGPKHFKPAVERATRREGLEAIAGATPYALRRGGISARLRSVDAQTVKSQCGTSLRMLDKHYSFDIDDLRRYGPVPLNDVWSDARQELESNPPPPPTALAGVAPERPKLALVA